MVEDGQDGQLRKVNLEGRFVRKWHQCRHARCCHISLYLQRLHRLQMDGDAIPCFSKRGKWQRDSRAARRLCRLFSSGARHVSLSRVHAASHSSSHLSSRFVLPICPRNCFLPMSSRLSSQLSSRFVLPICPNHLFAKRCPHDCPPDLSSRFVQPRYVGS